MTTFTRFFLRVLLIVEFLLIIGCTVSTEQDRPSGTVISETVESASLTPSPSQMSSTIESTVVLPSLSEADETPTAVTIPTRILTGTDEVLPDLSEVNETPTVVVTPTRILTGTNEDSLIVFAAQSSGAENIWEATTLFTITSNSENQQQLTFTDGFRSDPALSPDGNQIAYNQYDDNDQTSQIFIMNVDSSNVTQLTSDDFRNSSPSWSPDGKKIAYVSTRGEEVQIFVLNLETMQSTQLTSEGVNADPDWSPDGTQIVFVGVRELSGDPSFSEAIYTMDEDGGNQTPLVNECVGRVSDPVWRPDGQQIAFTCEVPNPITDQLVGKIHIMESDGSNIKQLTSNDPSIFEFRPKWSPDGMRLMYIQSDDVNVLFILDLATGETVRLVGTENVWAADW